MSILLFVKGDKGLVANDEGRFVFPDRNSDIKEEGLYDCTITIDKGKYAFVTGIPVKTMMPSADYMCKMICTEPFSGERHIRFDNACIPKKVGESMFINVDNVCTLKKIGDSIIVYNKKYDLTSIGYIDPVKGYDHISAYTHDLRDRNIAKLYDMYRFPDAIGYGDLRKAIIDKMCTKLEGDMIKKVATVALVKTLKRFPRHHVTSITVVDDQLIHIKTSFKLIGSCKEVIGVPRTYFYNKHDGVCEIGITDEEDFINAATKRNINPSEIINYAIENHLAVCHEETTRFTYTVNFMGNSIDVVCLNGNMFLDDIPEDDKAKAAESFNELEDYRRKVSKKISRSSIRELAKLSPRQVLGFAGAE